MLTIATTVKKQGVSTGTKSAVLPADHRRIELKPLSSNNVATSNLWHTRGHNIKAIQPKLSFIVALLSISTFSAADTNQHTIDTSEAFDVIIADTKVGFLNVTKNDQSYSIEFDVKNNGRGPTMQESIKLDGKGLPIAWQIQGTSTFGNEIDEKFSVSDGVASWVDATGPGRANYQNEELYVAQAGSPWSLGMYARAMRTLGQESLAALPGGELRIQELETMTVTNGDKTSSVTSHALTGIEMFPEYFLLDKRGELFATISPRAVVIRSGYGHEVERLRELAVKYSTERLINMQTQFAHQYDKPVRIRNARLFDPRSKSLTSPKDVVVSNNKIAAVLESESLATPNEIVVDAEGGTLVPGMFEMHGHLGQESAMLNVLAGITSVRDMGNDNDVLDGLVERIESGGLAGPRLVRSGFIEGQSPYSSNNGEIVSNEAEALAAARFYAARGYKQIKIYNSMNPEWVPRLIGEARSLGLRVAGHVPAFTTADAMIEAGYDELTHINQVMLGWVLNPGEDTRTLLRLTALKRLPDLDLTSPAVQHTLNAMVRNNVAIDPTFAIHEALLLSRNGSVRPGVEDYVEHLPIGAQRSAKQAWSAIDTPQDDIAYREAFDKITDTIRLMHERGIFIIPGTDLGGSFTYHRELELYLDAGFSPAEILTRATLEMAEYLDQDQSLGSIEKGKLADFFLIQGDPVKDLSAIKKIRMVVNNGTFYYPSEVYPAFGIKPFTVAPEARQTSTDGAESVAR